MKIRCPNCGAWIYIIQQTDEKSSEGNSRLDVKILEIKQTKKEPAYAVLSNEEKKQALDNILEVLDVLADVNGKLYRFEMWWGKKNIDGWIGGAKSISTYLNARKAKDIWADENNEIFVKQKYGIVRGIIDKSKMKIPEERMEEIARKLGLSLKTGREGLRIYLGEKYSERPLLSERKSLIEKMIKVWIAFWEPTMI